MGYDQGNVWYLVESVEEGLGLLLDAARHAPLRHQVKVLLLNKGNNPGRQPSFEQ